MKEYRAFVKVLREAGVEVIEVDNLDPQASNALFPNNVFTTHDSSDLGSAGLSSFCMCVCLFFLLALHIVVPTFVTYPMHSEDRRRERHPALLEKLHDLGFTIQVDLSALEENDPHQALEGTGALLLDRVHKVAFCNMSHRCTESASQQWASKFRYHLIPFQSEAHRHSMYDTVVSTASRVCTVGSFSVFCRACSYHTNVMLSIGASLAIVCAEVIESELDRKLVLTELSRYHEVMRITNQQMHHFCGNTIQVRTKDGRTAYLMSTRAYEHFTAEQLDTIRRHCDMILHSPLTVIEDEGGPYAARV
jgi:hypothetical protein